MVGGRAARRSRDPRQTVTHRFDEDERRRLDAGGQEQHVRLGHRGGDLPGGRRTSQRDTRVGGGERTHGGGARMRGGRLAANDPQRPVSVIGGEGREESRVVFLLPQVADAQEPRAARRRHRIAGGRDAERRVRHVGAADSQLAHQAMVPAVPGGVHDDVGMAQQPGVVGAQRGIRVDLGVAVQIDARHEDEARPRLRQRRRMHYRPADRAGEGQDRVVWARGDERGERGAAVVGELVDPQAAVLGEGPGRIRVGADLDLPSAVAQRDGGLLGEHLRPADRGVERVREDEQA